MADRVEKGVSGSRPGVAAGIAFHLFAVVLPLTALVFELVTHGCFEIFFDPIPTPLHVLLVACVPVANLFAWHVLGCEQTPYYRAAAWASSVAIGISAFYALLFVPLVPFSLLGILYFGLGMLPLAPLCACIGALRCRARLGRAARRAGLAPMPRAWLGVAAALVGVALLELPGAIV
jgi:hypothetical protein